MREKFDERFLLDVTVRYYCPIRGNGVFHRVFWNEADYKRVLEAIPRFLARNNCVFVSIQEEWLDPIPF